MSSSLSAESIMRRISDSVLSTAVRRRFTREEDKNNLPIYKKWSNVSLSNSTPSQFNISQHEMGIDSIVSQITRPRRGAISATLLPSVEENHDDAFHDKPLSQLQDGCEEEITVVVQMNGLVLFTEVIQSEEVPIEDLLKSVLTQDDQFDLNACTYHLSNMDSPVEFDLTTVATKYSGATITVDISNSSDNLPLISAGSTEDLPIEQLNSSKFTNVQQCLDYFDCYGIEPLSTGIVMLSISPCESTLPDLPKSWRDVMEEDIVKELCEGGGHAEDLQQYIWELVQTEHSHIQQLQVVVDLFMRALEYIMHVDVLTEVNYKNIFGNIKDILEAHKSFWDNVLLPCWQMPSLHKQPFDVEGLIKRFPEFSTQFEIYEQHCIFESENLSELNKAIHNQSFKAYLEWCEARPECHRLKLTDYLAKPMQRLTKYPLLLKQIVKAIDDQHQKERMDAILLGVQEFVTTVNKALQSQLEVDTVKNIMNRLDSYSAVTGQGDIEKVLHPFTGLDLLAPMPGTDLRYSRMLFHHDTMRCKESDGKERSCSVFIFTDLLLIARQFKKNSEHKLDVIKPPHRIDRIVLKHKDNATLLLVYINDFKVAIQAFSLRASDPMKAKAFEEKFEHAQEYYERLVLENAANGRQRMLASPSSSMPNTLDRVHLKGFGHHSHRKPSQLSEVSISFVGNRRVSRPVSIDSMDVGSSEHDMDRYSPVGKIDNGSDHSLERNSEYIRGHSPTKTRGEMRGAGHLSAQQQHKQQQQQQHKQQHEQQHKQQHQQHHEQQGGSVSTCESDSPIPSQHQLTEVQPKGYNPSARVRADDSYSPLSPSSSLPIRRVDTINTSTQSVTIAFEDLSSYPSTPDPGEELRVDHIVDHVVEVHSITSSSSDLRGASSDGMRNDDCSQSRTSSQLSNSVGNPSNSNYANHSGIQCTVVSRKNGRTSHLDDHTKARKSPPSSSKLQRFFKNRKIWRQTPVKSRDTYVDVNNVDEREKSQENSKTSSKIPSSQSSRRMTTSEVDNDQPSSGSQARSNSTLGIAGYHENERKSTVVYQATWV